MRVAFLVIENMLVTSMSNPFELFYAANQTAKMHRDTSRRDVELVKVAISDQRLDLPSGLSIRPEATLSKQPFDIIFVPALWRNPRPVVKRNLEIVEWLKWQFEHGAVINATGTGVCFMAETGLINNKPATTHWNHFEQFALDYPKVDLKRQHFITSAGKIYCAASINAQTDLALHHIRRVYSKEVSDHLARQFSHEVRKSFDRLSFNQEDNSNHPDETILQAQIWLQNHLSKTGISIQQLSLLFGMSQRNFTRRFVIATNMTPVQYLQSLRLQEAKELLQNSNLAIAEIAYRVGYIDVSYFTKLFKQFASTTPKKYRTSVRAKLFGSTELAE